MLHYQDEDFPYQAKDESQPSKPKKPRKSILRTRRRSLKKEFEKLLVPSFASKISRSYMDKSKSLGVIRSKKKLQKVLPDNLAEFIVNNESTHPVITDEEYMKCMQALTVTSNRKNQILQVCQILGR